MRDLQVCVCVPCKYCVGSSVCERALEVMSLGGSFIPRSLRSCTLHTLACCT